VTVPSPLAADGVVAIDANTRELVVKPAETGYAALLWREGHRALMHSEGTSRRGAPTVWAYDAGRNRLVYGIPEQDGTLRFRFARGEPAYQKLVGKPGLTATIVLDRETSHIMGVKFHNRDHDQLPTDCRVKKSRLVGA
jgi:hypothetical protein